MELISKKIGEFKAHSALLNPLNHICEFYPTAADRIRSICQFVVPGLIQGEATIVIATFENLEMLKSSLILYAIDVNEYISSGQLLLLDANRMLEKFIRNDFIDYFLFFNTMNNLLGDIQNRFSAIRAYGEMVDILYKTKNIDLTLELESLWSEVSLQYKFSLLCGYTADSFRGHNYHIKQICSSHTHLISKGILEIT